MAIVAASPAFKASINLVAKNLKTMTVNLSLVATTYSDAVTAVTAFLVDLSAVSAGVVKSYNITGTAINDALTPPVSDDAGYGEKAILSGNMDGNPLKSWTLYIPMPKIEIFLDTDGPLMDQVGIGLSAVTNYLANFTVEGEVATISDGEFIDQILAGRRVD
jgi:hypothetical protein